MSQFIRRLFSIVFTVHLCFLFLEGQDKNVLLIVCDDLRYFDFQDSNCPLIAPNLKALSESGIVFSNAHSNTPICSPSRASFLNGTYAHNNGYFGFNQSSNTWYGFPHLKPDSSIFGILKDNGYFTKISGKIFHNAPDSVFASAIDEFNRYGGFGPMPRVNNQDVAHPLGPPGISDNQPQMGPIVELADSTIEWFNHGFPLDVIGDSLIGLMPDELIRSEAVNFLNDPTHEQFIYGVGFHRPHPPLHVPSAYFDLYDINEIEIPEYMNDELLTQAIASFYNSYGSGGEEFYTFLEEASMQNTIELFWVKKYLQAYYASITFVDQQIGNVLNALDNSSYANNTLVILTSDNGFNLGDFNKIMNKSSMRNATSKIPFILRHPAIDSAFQIAKPISLIDITPTILDYTDVDIDQEKDGNSLFPLISSFGENWDGEDYALVNQSTREVIEDHSLAAIEHQHYGLVSQEYRFNSYSNGEAELYNLMVDPFEKNNLALNPIYESLRDSLETILLDEINVSRPVFDTINKLSYGTFDQDFNGWSVIKNDSNKHYIEINQQGDKIASLEKFNPGTYILLQNRVIFLEEGEDYTLSFDAKATHGLALVDAVFAFFEDNSSPVFYESIETSIDTIWTNYTIAFNYPFPTTKRQAGLRLILKNQNKVSFDNIQIVQGSVQNTSTCLPENYTSPPENLGISVTNNFIKFHWDSVPGAKKCELQGNVFTAPINQNVSVLIPAGNQLATSSPTGTNFFPLNTVLSTGAIIQYELDYRWRVRCGCSAEPVIATPFSPWQSFYLFLPPQTKVIEAENQAENAFIYPNPNSGDELFIQSEGLEMLEIYDSSMRKLSTYMLDSRLETQRINLNLPKGNYILHLFHQEEISIQKLIVH